jgi:CTP:phosphocholine cytidylyltransferase-like protein
MDLLPPASGFFFGTTDISEWYWEDIKDTIEKLNTALEQSVDDAMFEYLASW